MRLFEVISSKEAAEIFKKHGVDNALSLTKDDLKKMYKALVLKHHPDRGGNLSTIQDINAAYDVLKSAKPNMDHDDDFSYGAGSSYSSYNTETPEWAMAGYSGGSRPNGNISRNNFSDVNYFKKTMWELSHHSRIEYTIWAFDGHFFRGATTVYGSPEIYKEMAKAMIVWNGSASYDTRAVFFTLKKKPGIISLIYADGKFYDEPIEIEHESFNSNPGNDQSFLRKLPSMLDKLSA